LGGVPEWSIDGITGQQIHSAAVRGSQEIGTPLSEVTSITMKANDDGEPLLEVLSPSGLAEIPVG